MATKLKKTETTAIELREAWLRQLAALMCPIINEKAGGKLDFGSYRVSCGFPSRGGEMSAKGKRTQGQAWSSEASADKHGEVFVSPVDADARVVAEILAHELIHVALPKAGHKKAFQKVALAIGFTAPFTSTPSTPAFWEWVEPLLAQLGPYPHAELRAMAPVAAPKKKKTYLLKATCTHEGCGYTVRVTAQWVKQYGPPICPRGIIKPGADGDLERDAGEPIHGALMCELPEEDGEEEGGE